jgi:hypothetical protein
MAAATKEELLADVDVTKLPVRRVAPEMLTDEPLAEIAVGDLVVMHSRNALRVAQVLTVTPKRVMVAYTTEGAWTAARKIAEMYLTPGYVERLVGQARRTAGSNYDWFVAQSKPETASYNPSEADMARNRARVERETREEHIERTVREAREGAEAKVAEAKLGCEQYVTVTTKSVKRSDVYGLKS